MNEIYEITFDMRLYIISCILQSVLANADKDLNAGISFSEFIEYMQEHERKLRLAFSDLDHNKDGLF